MMLPFLIDVTGNSLDLYDTVVWWDDFNHFVNWVFLCLGPRARRRAAAAPRMGAGHAGHGLRLHPGARLGARRVLTFIRHGTELDTAYEDTLGDMTLGTLGSLVAGLLVLRLGRRPSS